jgi:hypothetical protein
MVSTTLRSNATNPRGGRCIPMKMEPGRLVVRGETARARGVRDGVQPSQSRPQSSPHSVNRFFPAGQAAGRARPQPVAMPLSHCPTRCVERMSRLSPTIHGDRLGRSDDDVRARRRSSKSSRSISPRAKRSSRTSNAASRPPRRSPESDPHRARARATSPTTIRERKTIHSRPPHHDPSQKPQQSPIICSTSLLAAGLFPGMSRYDHAPRSSAPFRIRRSW